MSKTLKVATELEKVAVDAPLQEGVNQAFFDTVRNRATAANARQPRRVLVKRYKAGGALKKLVDIARS